MSLTGERLLPHFETCVVAAADAMSFAAISAGNLVAVDEPTSALPLGGVRMVRARVAGDAGLDVVVALTDATADQACVAAGTGDDLAAALAPALHAMLSGLSALVHHHLELSELYEPGVGEPIGPAGTEAFTAGLFVNDEQIGNVIFFAAPGALSAPEPEIADFPDAADADGGVTTNPLSLLRGVEMRVTAELGRARLPVAHVLDLGPGSVVELDRVAGTPVNVLVNGTVIAQGEVVVVDDEYGVRITEIVNEWDDAQP
jgi:flagellar motor switch protein FliN